MSGTKIAIDDDIPLRKRRLSRSVSRSRSTHRRHRRHNQSPHRSRSPTDQRLRSRSPRRRRSHSRQYRRSRSYSSPRRGYYLPRDSNFRRRHLPTSRRDAAHSSNDRSRSLRQLATHNVSRKHSPTRISLDIPLLSFKEYVRMNGSLAPVSVSEKQYERYKSDYRMHHDKIMFDQYSEEEWMMERYDPEIQLKRQLANAKLIPERQAQFEADFKKDAIPEIFFDLDDDERAQCSDAAETIFSSNEGTTLKKDSDTNGDEVFVENSIFLRMIASKIKKADLLKHLENLNGFVKLTLSEPNRMRNFGRFAWATFTDAKACKNALMEISNIEIIPQFFLHPTANTKPILRRARKIPSVSLDSKRVREDFDTAKTLITKFDQSALVYDTNFLLINDAELLNAIENPLRRLNVLLAYLRRVHLVCYYSGQQFVDEEDIQNRNPEVCRRMREDEAVNATATDTAMRNLDEKLKSLLEISESKKYKNPEEHLENEINAPLMTALTEMHDHGKFRCGLCLKLFKGLEYVEKHLRKKHADNISAQRSTGLRNLYFKRFHEDPDHPRPPPAQPSAFQQQQNTVSQSVMMYPPQPPAFIPPNVPIYGFPVMNHPMLPPMMPPPGPPSNFYAPANSMPGAPLHRRGGLYVSPPAHAKRRKMVSYKDLDAPIPSDSLPVGVLNYAGLMDDDDYGESDTARIQG